MVQVSVYPSWHMISMATKVQASQILLPVVGSTCMSLYIQASHDEDQKNCICRTTVESSLITCLTIGS